MDALCFVGFGDVTVGWMDSLLAAGYRSDDLTVVYLSHDGGRGVERAREKAQQRGIALVTEPEKIPDTIEIFVHATAAAGAQGVFDLCLPMLRPGQLWLDVNSMSPTEKLTMAEQASERGVDFADGAIMGGAWQLGHKTPVWLSGEGTETFTSWAQRWGTPVVVVDGPAGAAAGIKMCRSLMTKSMAASVVEALTVAEMLGVYEPVVESLMGDYGEAVISPLVERYIHPTMEHAQRRGNELAHAVRMTGELGWEPATARGAREFFSRMVDADSRAIPAAHPEYRSALHALGDAITEVYAPSPSPPLATPES